MTTEWTGEGILERMRGYQFACMVGAAAELDLYQALSEEPRTAEALAERIQADGRGTRILADGLVALELLVKEDDRYRLADGVAPLLVGTVPGSVLAMVRHQMNGLRRWGRLAEVVRLGRPPERQASVRGDESDEWAFIEAMHVVSQPVAAAVVSGLGSGPFARILDVGAGPATWTIAFLEAHPTARATVYDLPHVIPMARRHVEESGLLDRVTFVSGDFEADTELPGGMDVVWISAIAHMNSREQNRALLGKAHAALVEGGEVMIRGIVMEPSHTIPAAGAIFAVNMLSGTPGGDTYTLEETTADLAASGFGPPTVIPGPRDMDTVLRSTRT